MTNYYFVGGEDIDFQYVGSKLYGGAQASVVGFWWSDTTANSFRGSPAFARCSMTQHLDYNTPSNVVDYIRASMLSAQSTFWATFRMNHYIANGGFGAGTASSVPVPLRFVDANGIVRLRIRMLGSAAPPFSTFRVDKVDAAGSFTQLGSNSTLTYSGTLNTAGNTYGTTPDKFDVSIDYGVSGRILIYRNGVTIFDSGTVDTTTNGNTTLQGMDLGAAAFSTQILSSFRTAYSEVLIQDEDTRAIQLQTRVATANGNTHNFTSGTAANFALVNRNTARASPQISATPGQIQQYQMTPAVVGGAVIKAVVRKVETAIGMLGPKNFEIGERANGVDTFSSDIAATGGWSTSQFVETVNPNTGLPYTAGDLTASSTLYNAGLKSVA